jgi:hypothetical protein
VQIGKLGRPRTSARDLRTLWYARYAAGANHPGYSAPPPMDDWTGPTSDYTWLGNDKVGCCTRTCYGHIIQQRSALLGVKCELTTDDILKSYKDGTGWDGIPGSVSDHGDQIVRSLTSMKNVGLHDGKYKIRQFGRVNHNDTLEMRAALSTFGALIIGANLPSAISRQGSSWDLSPVGKRQPDEAPGSAGGHAFIITAHQHGKWSAMPWIHKTQITYAWDDLYIDEAWFVIDDLWVTQNRRAPNGFDLARIEADAAAIAA